MSASGILKNLFILRYSISTMRTIVASPEKLHRLSMELWSRDSNRFAINVTQIWNFGVVALPIEVSKREILLDLFEE